jgi:hypothetical protein
MCNQISKPEFTAEQIAECKKCKHISGKQTWCCLFGCWIDGREEQRIIQPHLGHLTVPSKKIINPTKTTAKQGGCCGKAKSLMYKGRNIAIGWINMLLGKEKELAEKRIQLCLLCDKKYKVGRTLWCSICKCLIPAKVRIKDEHCPKGKW